MINDMKDRGSKEQEIHEIITRLDKWKYFLFTSGHEFRLTHSTLRMIQAVIREKPEDPLDFMISFIDTCWYLLNTHLVRLL